MVEIGASGLESATRTVSPPIIGAGGVIKVGEVPGACPRPRVRLKHKTFSIGAFAFTKGGLGGDT